MTTSSILNYSGKPVRTSVWAIVVFSLSVIGAITFFLGLPAIVALIASLVVRKRIGERLDVGGQNFAMAGVVVSAWSVALFVGWVVLMPVSTGLARSGVRTTCSSNLRGIMNCMVLYASADGVFPTVNFAPDAPRLNDPRGVSVKGDVNDVIKTMYRPGYPDAGSVAANLWLLVLEEGLPPKLLVCKSDPFSTGAANASDGSTGYFNNFQNGRQLSYSAAYAWRGDGKPGAWWKDTTDASLPLVADMTPMQGTGTPGRDLAPRVAPMTRASNSANHGGDGQNVAYGDIHVDFTRLPNCGQDNDNIYSMSGSPSLGPAKYGGIPAGNASPNLMAEKPPYDIIMLPVRNATTGGM